MNMMDGEKNVTTWPVIVNTLKKSSFAYIAWRFLSS